jgi:hypothetical protein
LRDRDVAIEIGERFGNAESIGEAKVSGPADSVLGPKNGSDKWLGQMGVICPKSTLRVFAGSN